MPQSITSIMLFQFENANISIQIKAYFDAANLIVEGYDIGKQVAEAFGDSDYEYNTTVAENEVKRLYPLFNAPEGDKSGLLIAIRNKFNTNTCYSEFSDFLMKNGIKSSGSAWT